MGARRAPRHVRPALPSRGRAGRAAGGGARSGRGAGRGARCVRGQGRVLIGRRRAPRPLTASRRGSGFKTKGRRPGGGGGGGGDASRAAGEPTAAARPGPRRGRRRAAPELSEAGPMGAAGRGADRRAAVSRAGPAGVPGGVVRGAGGALRRDHPGSARTATPGQEHFPGSPSSRPSPPRPGEGSGGAARLTVTGFSPKRKVAPGEGNEDKRGLPACSRKGGV